MRVLYIEPPDLGHGDILASITTSCYFDALFIRADSLEEAERLFSYMDIDLIICSCAAAYESKKVHAWVEKQAEFGKKMVILATCGDLESHKNLAKIPVFSDFALLFNWIDQNFPDCVPGYGIVSAVWRKPQVS